MKRLAHRLAVIGVVSGTLLAMSSAAVARPDKPPTKGTDCVVQHVDERGGVVRTETEPEGLEHGQFRCEGGQWTFAWDPFGADDMIRAGEIQIDPAGAVSARRFTGPALGNDLTVGEIATIAQAVSGSREVLIDRAIVAVDDGKERTSEQVAALLAGKDDTGVRVLDIIEKPEAAMSTKDVIDEAGGTPETTVVYFSIWGAIKSVFAWIVDTIGEIGEWIDDHCDVGSPNDFGDIVTCRW
ncbi:MULTISPECIES: hypothetical protein [unclassified Micromonospora]|uniref:hypothetical protein n=1 Tax=unclassified Micromonospora TaxID=2617518 RepID=UPI001B35A378|nr:MULTISPECIES: hypothetical protein [unclassified Micromonospora]MBQ0982512.1 hypothetical protein [Micromonospora sp. M61]MBQ1038334.1 hypothetical protein [Micromonospora sp. C81]